MILLNQTSTGRVAVQSSSGPSSWSSDYSVDMTTKNVVLLSDSNSQFVDQSQYVAGDSYRFCLSLITQDSFYNNTFTFYKNYTNSSTGYTLNAQYNDYTVSVVSSSTTISVWGIWAEWVKNEKKYRDIVSN